MHRAPYAKLLSACLTVRVAITMTIIHLVSIDTLQIGCNPKLCVGFQVSTLAADATMRNHNELLMKTAQAVIFVDGSSVFYSALLSASKTYVEGFAKPHQQSSRTLIRDLQTAFQLLNDVQNLGPMLIVGFAKPSRVYFHENLNQIELFLR